MRVRSAPKITRVHTLHRIKSVINHVLNLEGERHKEIDDKSVAGHLIETRLSKPTRIKEGDQICRRARDHLETARYLGLLYRRKVDTRKYTHGATRWGRLLKADSYDEDCPSSFTEEAVLADRLLRFKFANTSYLQTSAKYRDLRIRPCLLMLSALQAVEALDVFQLGYILSFESVDPLLTRQKLNSLINKVSTPSFAKTYLQRLDKEDKKNIRRDTLPFVDWLCQVNLVEKDGEQILITDKGRDLSLYYGAILPVWWQDLGNFRCVVSATIIFSNFLKLAKRSHYLKEMLKLKLKEDLFDVSAKSQLKLLGLLKHVRSDSALVDYSLQYDVPPDDWSNVNSVIQDISNLLNMSVSIGHVHRLNGFYNIRSLEEKAQDEAEKASHFYSKELRSKIKIPSTAVVSQFQSPYEAITYICLKQMETGRLNVSKYQAQFAELFLDLDRDWSRFATGNPDILSTNDQCTLIECKSTGEWGESLSLDKKVMSEMIIYNKYAESIEDNGIVKSCKVLFAYEGRISPEGRQELETLLASKYPRVFLVLGKFLQKALVRHSIKGSLQHFLQRSHSQTKNHVFG